MAGSKARARERYRFEAEQVAYSFAELDPLEGALRYDRIQRADWVASFSIESEAQRNEILACMVDYFFTGKDPSGKLNKQQLILWKAVEPRIRRARNTSKAKAEENFLETGEIPADISKEFTQKISENLPTFEEKPNTNLPMSKGGLPAETPAQHNDVPKDLLAINKELLPTNKEPIKQGTSRHLTFSTIRENGSLKVNDLWVKPSPPLKGSDVPTVLELVQFIEEQGLDLDPERFYYDHALNSWSGVTDWREQAKREARQREKKVFVG